MPKRYTDKQIEFNRRMTLNTCNIQRLPVDAVHVSSWCHSGPVSVDLEGVNLGWLLDKIDPDILREYLERYPHGHSREG